MRTFYPDVIAENETRLSTLERKLRGQKSAARIQMLRLLKSGQVETMEECAALIGYSPRNVKRWWKMYKDGGLDSLLEQKRYPGKESQLNAEAMDALKRAIRKGDVKTLENARVYLKHRHGIEYESVNGIWWMLKKNKIRLRNERP